MTLAEMRKLINAYYKAETQEEKQNILLQLWHHADEPIKTPVQKVKGGR